tara:strand:- start:1380 stop:2651 length:1272 start_codon:yes stop_codon:yes gene_type:complete
MARIAWGRNKTQLDLSTYPDNPSVPIGSSEWNQDPEDGGILGFTKQSATIASNTFAPTKSIIEISAGTVNTIGQTDTNEFDLLYLFASSGATVTLAHNNGGTGQVTLLAGVSKTISETSPTIVIRKGTSWVEYGGGITNALNDVGDVTVTSVASDEILQWNGSAWINQTFTEADIATATNLALKANLASPTFTGTVVLPNVPAIVTTQLDLKATLASPTFTGTVVLPNVPAIVTTQLDLKATLASPTFTGTAVFDDLTVNGTNTIINSTTLTVDDKNIEMGSVATPSDVTADGGGITLKGTSDKTMLWVDSTDSWTFNQQLDIGTNKIINVVDPTTAQGVATKAYVDANAGGATLLHEYNNSTQTTVFTVSTNAVSYDVGTTVASQASGVGQREVYIRKIDTNNEGVFTIIHKNGALVEVQIA